MFAVTLLQRIQVLDFECFPRHKHFVKFVFLFSLFYKEQLAFLTPPFLGYFFANPACVTPRNGDIL
jgi:hypothetical protein